MIDITVLDAKTLKEYAGIERGTVNKNTEPTPNRQERVNSKPI
jgi:hypothetical protein